MGCVGGSGKGQSIVGRWCRSSDDWELAGDKGNEVERISLANSATLFVLRGYI